MSFLDSMTGTTIREKDGHLAPTQEAQIARILLKSEKAFNARKRAKWVKVASFICEEINNILEIDIARINNDIEKNRASNDAHLLKFEEYEKKANVAKNYLDTLPEPPDNEKKDVKAKLKQYYTELDKIIIDNDIKKLSSNTDYDTKKKLLSAKLALGVISTLADVYSEVCEAAAHHHGPNPGEADFTYNFLARTADIKYGNIRLVASVGVLITKIEFDGHGNLFLYLEGENLKKIEKICLDPKSVLEWKSKVSEDKKATFENPDPSMIKLVPKQEYSFYAYISDSWIHIGNAIFPE